MSLEHPTINNNGNTISNNLFIINSLGHPNLTPPPIGGVDVKKVLRIEPFVEMWDKGRNEWVINKS